MAVTDLLKNGLADITGTVEKAIVMICDESLEDDLKKQESVKTKTSSSTAGGLGSLGGGLGNVAGSVADNAKKSALDAAKNAATDKLKKAAGEYAELAGIKAGSILGGEKIINYNREFSVQFNPSTMQLSARKYSEKDLTKGDASQNNNNINMASPYPDMVFSVTLLFERVVAAEAFMEDTRFKNLSTMARAVGKGVLDAVTGGFETVQNMVDGFIGAIRNKRTRRICFAWNNMRYEGILNGVNSKYTMFDLYGRPIRGEVRLTIRLSDMQINDIDMGYWQDAYDKAFGFDPTLDGTFGKLKNFASAVGNTLEVVQNAALQVANIGSQLADTIGGIVDIASGGQDDEEEKLKEALKQEIINKKKKDEEKRKAILEKKKEKTESERKFASGWTNEKSVSIDEEKRKEDKKPDEPVKKDENNNSGNNGTSGNTSGGTSQSGSSSGTGGASQSGSSSGAEAPETQKDEDTSINGMLKENKETIPIINGGSSGSRRNGSDLLR